MDPITTAILGAIAASTSKLVSRGLEDAYAGLKTLIMNRYGRRSEVAQAVRAVEEEPEKDELREWLKEEIAGIGADRDFDIYNAALRVRDEVEALPGGKRIIQVVQGGGMVAGRDIRADRGSTIIGRDQHNWFAESAPHIPRTAIGWILGVPAFIAIMAGFLIFGLSLVDVIMNPPDINSPEFADVPEGFGIGFLLLIVGFVVGAIGSAIDAALSSRSKR